MSAIVKTKLKAARDALTKKDYEKAQIAASDVLDYDPDNYNAYVRSVCHPALNAEAGSIGLSSSAWRCWSWEMLGRASK